MSMDDRTITSMSTYSFTAIGAPKVKQRPRLGRRGKVFTPQATHDAEALVARQYDGPTFEGPLMMVVDYFKDHQVITLGTLEDFENKSKLRGDLDNYLKLTSDALNGLAYNDDKQIKLVKARAW